MRLNASVTSLAGQFGGGSDAANLDRLALNERVALLIVESRDIQSKRLNAFYRNLNQRRVIPRRRLMSHELVE